MNFKSFALSLFLLLVAAGARAERELLQLHGSNTVGAELAPALAKQWLRSRGYQLETERRSTVDTSILGNSDGEDSILIELAAHGSSTGFRDMSTGTADVAMASRRIKQKELEKLRGFGNLDALENEYVIALDGIAIIVHPENPIDA